MRMGDITDPEYLKFKEYVLEVSKFMHGLRSYHKMPTQQELFDAFHHCYEHNLSYDEAALLLITTFGLGEDKIH